MSFQNNLTNGFNSLIKQAGRQVTVRYFNQTTGSVYDDDVTLAVSGNVTTSGIVLPLDTREGSRDSVLLEQGKLIDSDRRLYVNGSLLFQSGAQQVKVIIGNDSFAMIPDGGIQYEAEGTSVYKKVFLRVLTNGSLIGE